jgi:hypothetical protein
VILFEVRLCPIIQFLRIAEAVGAAEDYDGERVGAIMKDREKVKPAENGKKPNIDFKEISGQNKVGEHQQ